MLFAFDRWELQEGARRVLKQLAAEIQQHSVQRIRIEGHTDNIGGAEYNRRLSEKRALAVRRYLQSLPGLQNLPMGIHGYGESRPVASNATEKDRERNRRLEIVVLLQPRRE